MLTKRDTEARLLRASKDMSAEAHPIEVAELYEEYVKQGIKPSRIAEVVGKSRSFVGNMLRLLNLPEDTINDFYDGLFSVSVAIDALKHAADDGDKAARYINAAIAAAGSDPVSVKHLPKYKQRPHERLANLAIRFVALHERGALTDEAIDDFVADVKDLVVVPQVKKAVAAPVPTRRRGIPS